MQNRPSLATRPRSVRVGLFPLLSTLVACAAHASDAPRLALPIDCEPGRTCFIQNYVDVDPGQGVKDYACGRATYDGHKGVDFRVPAWRTDLAGTKVLAAAPGLVKGQRDGMPDLLLRDYGKTVPLSVLDGKECGNGLVVDHGGGWETQYCHLKRDSVLVKGGEKVERGTPLGVVGASGKADFAHLHLSVRHNGKVIDPFTVGEPAGACLLEPASAKGLWDDKTAAALAHRTGQILVAGITGEKPDNNAIERGNLPPPPEAASAVLIAYATVMNVIEGDILRLLLRGPEGQLVSRTTEAAAKPLASSLSFAGVRLKEPRWKAGRYTATAEVLRAGQVIDSARVTVDLP